MRETFRILLKPTPSAPVAAAISPAIPPPETRTSTSSAAGFLIIDIGGSRGPETLQGDWHLSTENFPDPSAMTAKLAKLGTRVMVSVWPGVVNGSAAFPALVAGRGGAASR